MAFENISYAEAKKKVFGVRAPRRVKDDFPTMDESRRKRIVDSYSSAVRVNEEAIPKFTIASQVEISRNTRSQAEKKNVHEEDTNASIQAEVKSTRKNVITESLVENNDKESEKSTQVQSDFSIRTRPVPSLQKSPAKEESELNKNGNVKDLPAELQIKGQTNKRLSKVSDESKKRLSAKDNRGTIKNNNLKKGEISKNVN